MFSGVAFAGAVNGPNPGPGGPPPTLYGVGGAGLGSADLTIVVSPNGTVAALQSKGNTTCPGAGGSCKISTGTYDVRFARNVSRCAYIATIGLAGNSGTSAPGFITVSGRTGTVNGVFVQTYNVAGAAEDRGFHLHVNC